MDAPRASLISGAPAFGAELLAELLFLLGAPFRGPPAEVKTIQLAAVELDNAVDRVHELRLGDPDLIDKPFIAGQIRQARARESRSR